MARTVAFALLVLVAAAGVVSAYEGSRNLGAIGVSLQQRGLLQGTDNPGTTNSTGMNSTTGSAPNSSPAGADNGNGNGQGSPNAGSVPNSSPAGGDNGNGNGQGSPNTGSNPNAAPIGQGNGSGNGNAGSIAVASLSLSAVMGMAVLLLAL